MCSPGAFMGMQAMGAASSAYGAYQGAKSQQGVLNTQAAIDLSQANIANINAGLAEQQAQVSLEQGQKQAQSLMLKAAHLKSAQKTGMAANNIDLSSRSAQRVMVSADMMKAMDVNQIELNAMRASWGYKTQATNYTNNALALQAKSAGESATANAINPFGMMTTSLIGSASKVAMSYYTAKSVGMFDAAPTGDTSGMATFNIFGNVNSESNPNRWGNG